MSAGLNKCIWVASKIGKVIKTAGVKVTGDNIADVQVSYQLGIYRKTGTMGGYKEISHLHRVRWVLKNQQNSRNKSRAINF